MSWTNLFFDQPKAPAPPVDDALLSNALKCFITAAWNLKSNTSEHWGLILPVRIGGIKFPGWGYVEGRTSALKVNSSISIVEADDDMDFTDHCVLINGTPCLILHRAAQFSVTIIAKTSLLDQVMHTHAMPMNSLEQFKALPAPVQLVMRDIMLRVLQIHEKKVATTPEPIERILEYFSR